MTSRAYFILLRPERTFASAFGYLLYGLVLSLPFGVKTSEFGFVFLCLVAPVVLGLVLAAPLHEASHRSTFPLLPGTTRWMLRHHLAATSIVGMVLFATAVCVTTVKAPAALGLIAAGLTLPLLNPNPLRTWRFQLRPDLLVVVGVIVLVGARGWLAALCQQVPWAVLLAGSACAAACFRYGFTTDQLRRRQANPFDIAPQSTGPDMSFYMQAQFARLAEQRDTRTGARWKAKSVSDSLGGWLRIVHHSRVGKPGWTRSDAGLFALTLLGTGALIGEIVFGFSGSDPRQQERFHRLVATFAVTSGQSPANDARFLFALASVAGYCAALVGALGSAVPAWAFPLSRARLASSLFLNFERRAFTALLGAVGGTIAVFAIASRVADAPFELGSLRQFLPTICLVPIAFNLSLAALFLRDAFSRGVTCFIVFPGFIVAVSIAAMVSPSGNLGLHGLVLYATGIVLSGGLGWYSLRYHYSVCDLSRVDDWLVKLGFRKA